MEDLVVCNQMLFESIWIQLYHHPFAKMNDLIINFTWRWFLLTIQWCWESSCSLQLGKTYFPIDSAQLRVQSAHVFSTSHVPKTAQTHRWLGAAFVHPDFVAKNTGRAMSQKSIMAFRNQIPTCQEVTFNFKKQNVSLDHWTQSQGHCEETMFLLYLFNHCF